MRVDILAKRQESIAISTARISPRVYGDGARLQVIIIRCAVNEAGIIDGNEIVCTDGWHDIEIRFSNGGGTLDFYDNDDFIKKLFPTENYTRDQFSFQISDHFPVWVQIKTDIENERLTQIVQNRKQR